MKTKSVADKYYGGTETNTIEVTIKYRHGLINLRKRNLGKASSPLSTTLFSSAPTTPWMHPHADRGVIIMFLGCRSTEFGCNTSGYQTVKIEGKSWKAIPEFFP